MRWRAVTVRLHGFKELDRALGQLPKATAKNVMKRTLMKAAKPVDDAASANAPKDTGKLETSVIIGTRLTRSQVRGNAERFGINYYAEVHIGTALGRGMFTNFGTFKDPPQLWFDRAWASTQHQALSIIAKELGAEIEKAAKRYAKKLAKGA